MKNYIILLYFLTISNIYSQNEYDVRKTKWGMSVSDVITSEEPLRPLEIESNELSYNNVELSNGIKATILFSFKNKKLIEVRYLIYGLNSSFSRGTCENIISLSDKIRYTNFVFGALKNKNYKCEGGWHLLNHIDNLYPVGIDNCKLDISTIEKIEKIAYKLKEDRIDLDFGNNRSNAVFTFNQFQNTFDKNGKFNFKCNHDFYNIYYWLVFTPNRKIESQLKKNDF